MVLACIFAGYVVVVCYLVVWFVVTCFGVFDFDVAGGFGGWVLVLDFWVLCDLVVALWVILCWLICGVWTCLWVWFLCFGWFICVLRDLGAICV